MGTVSECKEPPLSEGSFLSVKYSLSYFFFLAAGLDIDMNMIVKEPDNSVLPNLLVLSHYLLGELARLFQPPRIRLAQRLIPLLGFGNKIRVFAAEHHIRNVLRQLTLAIEHTDNVRAGSSLLSAFAPL